MNSDIDLVAKFQEFCTLAGSEDKTLMTSTANHMLVSSCFDKDYKIYDVNSICEAIVFPALKEQGKPYIIVNKANVDEYITKTAHEITKIKTQNTDIAVDDAEVKYINADLRSCISGEDPHVKNVVSGEKHV